MPRRAKCRAGLHDLTDPDNVIVNYRRGVEYRLCRPCRLAYEKAQNQAKAARLRQLEWSGPHRRSTKVRWAQNLRRGLPNRSKAGPLRYQVTPREQAALQLLADGMTLPEIAEAMCVGTKTVYYWLTNLRQKYGVATNPEAVAQGLKRGAVRADKVTARRLSKSHDVVHHAYLVRQSIQGAREPYAPRSRALREQLDVLMSWTPEHAVSVLWAAGRITSRHVPTTPYRYRGSRPSKSG